MREQNDQIFRQLEEAMTVSVEPLDKMFRAAGMPTDRIIEQVRRGYSGQGGPLMPLSFSTKGEEPDRTTMRANRILEPAGPAEPVPDRRRKGALCHAGESRRSASPPALAIAATRPAAAGCITGTDFAGAHGTADLATADGVVTHAGWQSGYGRLVKIQHEFGIETRYAHLSQHSREEGPKGLARRSDR